MNIHEITFKINEYFINRDDQSSIEFEKVLILNTIDLAKSIKYLPTTFDKLSICIKNFTYNIFEFFKSNIKRRKAVYKFAVIKKVGFRGTMHINFINGTVVILFKEVAYKFYFKDQQFFQHHYNTLKNFLGFDLLIDGNIFGTKQVRHTEFNDKSIDYNILSSIFNQLESYDKYLSKAINTKEKYYPNYKILQISKFNDVTNSEIVSDYLKIANVLTEKTKSLHNGFCHGDLWQENILIRSEKEFVLIDYDKTVYFCKIYDCVYFYLMSKRSGGDQKLTSILQKIDDYVNEICIFINQVYPVRMDIPKKIEIWFSIYLFVLLKLSEHDFRSSAIGKNIKVLTETLSPMTSR